MIFNAGCKFCGEHIQLDIDLACEVMFSLQFCYELAACNRCATFYQRMSTAAETCERSSKWLMECERARHPDLKKIDAKVRADVDKFTRGIVRICAEHFNTTPYWEKSFADMIIDHPNKAAGVVKNYVKGLERQVIEAKQQEVAA